MNLRVDDCILEYYKKLMYKANYNPMIYRVNDSNFGVRIEYADV